MTFEARIKRIFPETDKIKATVGITIDGSYAVREHNSTKTRQFKKLSGLWRLSGSNR